MRQGILIKLPTSTRQESAQKKLTQVAEGKFGDATHLPSGAEYVFVFGAVSSCDK